MRFSPDEQSGQSKEIRCAKSDKVLEDTHADAAKFLEGVRKEQRKIREVEKMHDKIRADHDEIRADHDEIRADHDEIRADHDEIRADHDKIRADLDQHVAWHQAEHSEIVGRIAKVEGWIAGQVRILAIISLDYL